MLQILVGIVLVAALAAAALVVYLLLGRNLEHRLAVLDAVADLSQRLGQIEEGLDRNATPPLERKLDLVAQRIGQIEGRLAALGEPLARPAADVGEAATDREVVVRALAPLGHGPIHFVSEDEIPGGLRELRIETSRDDVVLKGSVFVANGTVVETRLTPIFELFP